MKRRSFKQVEGVADSLNKPGTASHSRLFKQNSDQPTKCTETMKKEILETYLHLKKQMKR